MRIAAVAVQRSECSWRRKAIAMMAPELAADRQLRKDLQTLKGVVEARGERA